MLERIVTAIFAGFLISCVLGMVILTGLVAWQAGPLVFWLLISIFTCATACVFFFGTKKS